MEDAWARVCPFKSAHYSVPFVIQPGYTVCRVYVPFQECAVCTLVCVYHLYGGAAFIPHPLSQLSGGWQIPYSPKPTPYLNILSCFIVSGLIFRPEEKFKCMTSDVPGKTQKFGQCLKENVFFFRWRSLNFIIHLILYARLQVPNSPKPTPSSFFS